MRFVPSPPRENEGKVMMWVRPGVALGVIIGIVARLRRYVAPTAQTAAAP